jgi:hypothetical protein
MRLIIMALFGFFLVLASATAHGQEVVVIEQEGVACMSPSVCVPKEDMDAFVELLREKKCLQNDKPEFKLDPINIVVDKDGRVFYSGAMPHPYKLHMKWCGYEITAEGQIKLTAAMNEPPIWGFRFRPKAYISFLLAEPFYELAVNQENPGLEDVLDAGVMVDFLYYDFVNLNAAVGFQSVGGGVGFDITKNFGAYVGYGLSWGRWHHNPNAGVYFGF